MAISTPTTTQSNEQSAVSDTVESDTRAELKALREQMDRLQRQQDILLGVSRETLKKQMDGGNTLGKGTRKQLKRLFDDIHEPSTFNSRQQEDLRVAGRTVEKLQRWTKQLSKGADSNFNMNFPLAPEAREVNYTWERIMYKIRRVAGLEDEEPERLPTPKDAGYLTARVQDILAGRMTDREVEDMIVDVKEHVQSPFAVLALASAIFCRDLFQSPEPMCGTAPPSLMAVYDMHRSISTFLLFLRVAIAD